MHGEIVAFVQGFPDFLLYTVTAGAMLVMAMMAYIILTPWKELTLVKDQNRAAGLALSGAILGLGLPLAACLATSTSLPSLIIWGFVALLIQLLVYRITDLLLGDLPARIREDQIGPALVLVSAKLTSSVLLSAGLWDPNFHTLT